MGEEIIAGHSKGNMASYGFGKFLTEFMEMAFTSLLYFFYVRTVGVDPLIVGLGTVIFAIWNAVNDPLVGYLTNRPFKFTKKWGRRFPWIMIGGIPYILCYILIFTPPNVDPQSGAWIIFIWFIATTCIFDLFNSIFFVNFSSLFPDKFRSAEERRTATGIQTPIGIIGVALGAILPPLIIDYDLAVSFIINAGAIIIVGIIVLFLSVPGCREDQITIDKYLDKHERKDESVSFFGSLKSSLKQKSFLFFIISYTLYRTLVISITASIPFVVEFALAEEETMQTLLSAGFLIGALIGSPVWALIALRTNNNKMTMLISSFLLALFTIPFIFPVKSSLECFLLANIMVWIIFLEIGNAYFNAFLNCVNAFEGYTLPILGGAITFALFTAINPEIYLLIDPIRIEVVLYVAGFISLMYLLYMSYIRVKNVLTHFDGEELRMLELTQRIFWIGASCLTYTFFSVVTWLI